jgi:hypothetical protein
MLPATSDAESLCDLQARVIEAIEAGRTRRDAVESFQKTVSSAVKWLQRWRDKSRAEATRWKHFSVDRVRRRVPDPETVRITMTPRGARLFRSPSQT